MIQRISSFIILFLILFYAGNLKAQDNCSGAVTLCASSSITRTTVGQTAAGTDPALSCGDGVVQNSVWFNVIAANSGTCTISVSHIDNNPGLAMEIYTGTCGALVATPNCTTGSSATGGNMSLTFATTAGTTYFIMIDGEAGNGEAFDIVATTTNDGIIARPDANFNINPSDGCVPLTTLLDNQTALHGGSNITYEWKIDAGSFVPATGTDSTITINAVGTHTINLRVCNLQCGCKTVSQDVVAQNLFPVISYLPTTGCLGTPITFNGTATIQPDPPFVDPNVTNWSWNFGDAASGAANNATGQSVTHTFITNTTTFNVRLIAQGVCGPDTTFSTVTLLPSPVVTIGGPSSVCLGDPINLTSNFSNATPPIQYTWSGAGIFSCTTCPATGVTGLVAGGPYNIDLSIIDNDGCTADTVKQITVNPKPTVFAGGGITVCKGDTVHLNAIPSGGTAPYIYLWSPSAGLSNSTVNNPFTTNTNGTSYCVTVTDSKGCTSDPDCANLMQYPQPVITPATANLCTSAMPLQNTFTVSGANPGSTFSWKLSAAYSLITAAAGDSSFVTATFPPVAGTYSFTAVIVDGVTGCHDTVTTSFTVTPGITMSVSGPIQICSGDSATLTASGATTYSWSASPAFTFADSTSATQSVTPPVTTTYTITGTTGTCSQTLSYTLTVAPKPTVVINPITPFCGCSNVTLSGIGSSSPMNYLWTSANGNIIASPNALVTSVFICSSDSITLTVTDPSSSCFSSLTAAAVSKPKPDAEALVSPDLICDGAGTLISLSGTGSNTDAGTIYHWMSNDPSVVIGDTTAITTSATVSTATIFYLTVTDSAGCDSVATDSVNIYPLPVFAASSPFLCTTDPLLQSTLAVTGASPGSNYNWTIIPSCVTPATTINDFQLFDFSTCGTGTFPFAVTVTDIVTGCINSLSAGVVVVNGVTLVHTPDVNFCEGGSTVLNASGANTYTWSTGATTDSIVVSGLTAAGSPYDFIVTGNIGSCNATDTITVTVDSIPATSPISGPASICQHAPASVYTVNPPSGNYTWTVTGGVLVAGQNSPSIVVNWDSTGVGMITVVDTNAAGCAGPLQSMSVLINPLPDTPSVTGPTVVCSASITDYFVNAHAGSSYTWAITGGNFTGSPTGVTNSFQWGAGGIANLAVYETSGAGCAGPAASYNVQVNPRPLPVAVSGSQTACDNITSLFTLPFHAGSTFTWNVVNAVSTMLNPPHDSLTVNWAGSGPGSVSIFETNSFGCNSDTNIIPVTIYLHPQVSVMNDSAAICNNAPYQLSASSTTPVVKWTTDGAGSFDNDTLVSPVYTSGTDTGYVHLFMVAENLPCVNDTANVTLYLTPSPVVNVSGPVTPLCYGTTDTLRATGGGTYVWTPGGIPSPVIAIRPLVTTIYVVAVTNTFNCTTYDSTIVDVIPPGIPDAGADQAACVGNDVPLSGTQQNAGGIMWTTSGDGTFIPDNISSTVNYSPGIADTVAGSVAIYLVTTGSCLNLTDTLNISIQHHPSIEAGNDTTLLVNSSGEIQPLQLSPDTDNVPGVVWTTSGTGTFTPSDSSVDAIYTPSDADMNLDSVILTVTTTGSCTPVSDRLVLDFSPFIFPNVFTPYPSSPGKNDFFVIRNLTADCRLEVWDRWGGLVYKSESYQNDWDAYGLKNDTYYYLLVSEEKKYKGWVEVIRGE